ncbi:cobalamin B12-binding domain-containing protein [Saccharothrix sp. 6-C]|uniref:cobalamin B12-binding domain-containing protein n=1 Tax=Saccharothrix sp. 6-C TaxID=2781735 RepID=UPI001EEA7E9E|nr:cobalamin-dependent protein [Saccharothrix sp. 6-C]
MTGPSGPPIPHAPATTMSPDHADARPEGFRADLGTGDGAGGVVAATVERLWPALIAGDEYAATDVVLDALAAGVPAETVLLDVIGAAQARVGVEWAANRVTVAQEHAVTAINDRVVGVLSASLPRLRPHRARVAVACVDGEWHALPARLLAEVLRLRGFAVDYLGAQVPTPHLVAHLHRTGPDVVALSASLATRLPRTHAAITACQAAGVPVLAGGAAFGADGRHARRLGADAWAPHARAAADLLVADPPGHPRPASTTADHLPHLGDQEYTLVARGTVQLVKNVYTGLEQRFDAMRAYSDLQREHTADDLTHITEFLAAALYTDDAAVFTDFTAWTAHILTTRGVPGHLLPAALRLLADELRDFPRATAMLTAARRRLPAPDAGSSAS